MNHQIGASLTTVEQLGRREPNITCNCNFQVPPLASCARPQAQTATVARGLPEGAEDALQTKAYSLAAAAQDDLKAPGRLELLQLLLKFNVRVLLGNGRTADW